MPRTGGRFYASGHILKYASLHVVTVFYKRVTWTSALQYLPTQELPYGLSMAL